MTSDTDDPTTLGHEPPAVSLHRRREERTDYVHDIPFNERAEVTCPECGESITVGIYGAQERSYDTCWTWNCDAYHKFQRNREAESTADHQDSTVQTQLVADGGRYQYDQDGQREADDRYAAKARNLARAGILTEARREAGRIQHYQRSCDVLDEVRRRGE